MLAVLEFSFLRWQDASVRLAHGGCSLPSYGPTVLSLPLCFASFIVNSVKFIFLSYIISSQGIINALIGQHAIIIPFSISGILYEKNERGRSGRTWARFVEDELRDDKKD